MTLRADMSHAGTKHIYGGVFVEDAAWHKEGFVISKEEARRLGILGIFEKAGMNWTVELRNLKVEHDGRIIKTDFEGITRSDTGKVFGPVTDKYHTFQNAEIAAHAQAYVDTGLFDPSAAVSLKDGAWNSTTLQLGEHTLSNGDKLKKYVVFCWGHDGKQGVRVILTNVRVVCCNTFRIALSEAKEKSIRHKGGIREKMDTIRTEHMAMLKRFDTQNNFFEELLKKPISRTQTERYLDVMDFDKDEVFHQMLRENDTGTLFQAYQSVSRWSDHISGGKKVKERQIYVLQGGGAKRMEAVTEDFKQLLALPFRGASIAEPEFKAWLDTKIKEKEEATA